VLTLLVDPWAKPGQLSAPNRLRWVPESTDIVDPWARGAQGAKHVQDPGEVPAEPPRVAASRRADAPRDTIF
jgi:hypothetical protein